MRKARLFMFISLAVIAAVSLVSVSNAQQSSLTRVGNNYVSIGYWCKPPSICSVFPAFGFSGCTAVFSVFGAGFQSGARVELVQGNRVIAASCVRVLCPYCIICTVDLRGAQAGHWDVRVTNPDGGSATLREGFLVIGCSFPERLDEQEAPQPAPPAEGGPGAQPLTPGEGPLGGDPGEGGEEGEGGEKEEQELPSPPAQDPATSVPQQGAEGKSPELPPRQGRDGIGFFPRWGRMGQVVEYEITGYAYVPNLRVILRREGREVVSLNCEAKDGVIRGWIPLEYVWPGLWEIILQPPASDSVSVDGGFLVCE